MISFLTSHWNHMLWPLIWTVSSRQFRWGVTTNQQMFLCRIYRNYPLLSPNTPSYLDLWFSFVFSIKTYSGIHHWNHLFETVLMRGHNICFYWNIRKIIFELSLIPPLILSSTRSSLKWAYIICADISVKMSRVKIKKLVMFVRRLCLISFSGVYIWSKHLAPRL